MWLWTRQEAKRIDELSIQSGLTAESLMETAGQNMAAQIFGLAPLAKSAAVLCGPGNNGGDGFVVARELLKLGLEVTAVEIPNESDLRSLKKSEFPGPTLTAEVFLKNPKTSDIWIDGLFGIGLSRDLEGVALQLIQKVNRMKGLKFALDLPSGLEADTGNSKGVSFRADFTLTIGSPKPGFYFNQGPQTCGQIKIVEAGFPSEIAKREARSVFLLTPSLIRHWLPTRKSTDNKSQGGRTLICAGSSEMPGAALLACEAASRVGSGYVYCSEKEVLKFRPEVIPSSCKSNSLEKISAVLIGPGFGTGSQTLEALLTLRKFSIPAVVDADAITVASLNRKKISPFPKHWIATPHAGELSRLLGASVQEIESNRLSAVRQAQKEWGGIFLLKGFHTVVAYPQFSVIVPTGNAALSKGGSGDVLGGMIAGFLAQGVSIERAPLLAAFLHGSMADQWLRDGNDILSLTPQDLLQSLPQTLKRWRSS